MVIDIMGQKMTPELWQASTYFKESEAWGNPGMMARELIEALNAFRDHVGRPVIVHCGTQGAHVQNSYHYRGEAVDIHVDGMNVIEQFLAASRFTAFRGLGLYPYWNNPGLHLDCRTLTYNAPRARWLRDKAGNYVNITPATLGAALAA